MDQATSGWILDGNYSRTQDLKLRYIDTIIWLDYSFSFNLYRSIKRAITRAVTQKNYGQTRIIEKVLSPVSFLRIPLFYG